METWGRKPLLCPFSLDYNYFSAGTWPLFGLAAAYGTSQSVTGYGDNGYYHENPAAAHWDGHVSAYSEPAESAGMRKHLTRDGTATHP